MLELHEKITAMREYITEHGMCKFQLEDENGRVCLVGAFERTPAQSYEYPKPFVLHFLPRLAIELGLAEEHAVITDEYGTLYRYGPDGANIAFNNHPDTTEADMIEFLRIAEIRAKELA